MAVHVVTWLLVNLSMDKFTHISACGAIHQIFIRIQYESYRPLKLTQRHGHFFNSTGDMRPSDM